MHRIYVILNYIEQKLFYKNEFNCIFYRITICFIGLLILISTVHDCWMRTLSGSINQNIQLALEEQKAIPVRILQCFSVLRNANYLFSNDSGSFPDDTRCLQGIRVLSFFVIISAHMGVEIFRHPQYNNGAQLQVNILYTFNRTSHTT